MGALTLQSASDQSCPRVAQRRVIEAVWAQCRLGVRRFEAWLTEGRVKLYIEAP